MNAIDFLYREKIAALRSLAHAKTLKNDRDRIFYAERVNFLNVLIARARCMEKEERHARG